MIKRVWMILLILFAVAGFSGMAMAELVTIGTATYNGKDYKLIYEDDQGLIWLDYSFPDTRWPQQMALVSKMNDAGVLTCKFNPGVEVNWRGHGGCRWRWMPHERMAMTAQPPQALI